MSAVDQTNAANSTNMQSNNHTAIHRNSPAGLPDQKTAAGTSGGFHTGQVIKGEIIDIRDKDIKIQLDDARIIQAKIEGAHTMSIGDKASFQVSSTGFHTMSLKIRSQGYAVSQEYILEKALDEAALPHTLRNLTAVKALLDNQLSINKASIQQLLKQAAIYQNASLETLALMNKHAIPIDMVTSAQFEAYRNFEHRIVNQLDALLTRFIESDPQKASFELFHQILTGGAPTGDETTAPYASKPTELPLALDQPISAFLSAEERSNLLETIDSPQFSQADRTAVYNGTASTKETAVLIAEALTGHLDSYTGRPYDLSMLLQEHIVDLPDQLKKPEIYSVLENYKNAALDDAAISSFLSYDDRKQLLEVLTPLHLLQQDADALLQGDIPAKEIVPVFDQYLQLPEENIGKLIDNPAYQAVIKNLMISHWTLEPKDLTEPDAVRNYYDRLDKELEELEKQEVSAFSKNEDVPLIPSKQAGTASNIRDNIDFMKTLNQMFTYFQMPLRLPSQNVHSEFYVYTNKKALRQNKDQIKVLLHLDMKHLGSLDIHVEMHAKNIGAKFYTDQTDSFSIISENLPFLQQRLSEKGYLLRTEVLQKQKEIDIVDDFIAPKETGLDMKRYSFDIRA